eukprot:SAG22_NODE_7145_length_771_cov_1.566964_1_plen_132_part_10
MGKAKAKKVEAAAEPEPAPAPKEAALPEPDEGAAPEEPPRIEVATQSAEANGKLWASIRDEHKDTVGVPAPCFSAEDGQDITYVIPCQSCSAFLSLTQSTGGEQVCQACSTVVDKSLELLRGGPEGVEELMQ